MTSTADRGSSSTTRDPAFAAAVAIGVAAPLARGRGADRYWGMALLVVAASCTAATIVTANWTARGIAVKTGAALAGGVAVAVALRSGYVQPVLAAGLFGAVAGGTIVRWEPLPGRRTRPSASTVPAIGPLMAAEVTWWRSARVPLVLVLCAAAIVFLELSVWAPGVVRRTERLLGSVAECIAQFVARILAVTAWVALLVPTWALSRLAGYHPLDRGRVRSVSAWVPATTGPPSARRLGTHEFAPPAPVRRHRIARNVLGVLLLTLAILLSTVVRKEDHSASPRKPDTIDLRRRSAEPGKPAAIPDSELKWNDVRVDSYAHEDEPWIGDFFRELIGVQNVPDLILGHRNGDFAGTYLNIENGRRASYSAPDADLVVWFFGGSTMFGIGQRDDHTISSVVAHLAEADGLKLTTLNFGVAGDVNWQETIRLMEALQSDLEQPDLIVFYDGVNDAGLPPYRIENGLVDPTASARFPVSDAERDAGRVLPADAPAMAYGDEYRELQVELGSSQYRRGADSARRIADSFGVPIVNFWQPQPFAKKLSPADDELYRRLGLPTNVNDYFAPTYRATLQRSGVDAIDLTTVLDDVTVPVFFDTSHTNELGARVVAAAMYEHLESRLRAAARDR